MTKVTQLNLDQQGERPRIQLREISGDSETPLETVGQDLRTARLRRGDDLATVSRALKIRKDHLDALEEDRLENLPGRTYAIGFVRSYAGYLGLDVPVLVERFKQEITGRHDDHLPSIAPIADDEPRRLPYGWRIVAGVVVLALAYGVWHLLVGGSAPENVPPPPSLAPPKVVSVFKPAPAPPVQSATPSPASNEAAPPLPAPTAQPAATPSPALLNSKPPAAQPGTPAVPAVASGTVYGKTNPNVRLVLRATGMSRLTVRGADGSLYINRDLKPGDSYMVPNLPGLTMATSNAGAVEVVLDGQALGKLGTDQQILGRVGLDPQSLMDRTQTH